MRVPIDNLASRLLQEAQSAITQDLQHARDLILTAYREASAANCVLPRPDSSLQDLAGIEKDLQTAGYLGLLESREAIQGATSEYCKQIVSPVEVEIARRQGVVHEHRKELAETQKQREAEIQSASSAIWSSEQDVKRKAENSKNVGGWAHDNIGCVSILILHIHLTQVTTICSGWGLSIPPTKLAYGTGPRFAAWHSSL